MFIGFSVRISCPVPEIQTFSSHEGSIFKTDMTIVLAGPLKFIDIHVMRHISLSQLKMQVKFLNVSAENVGAMCKRPGKFSKRF